MPFDWGSLRDVVRKEGPHVASLKLQGILGLGKYDPATKSLRRRMTGDLGTTPVLESYEGIPGGRVRPEEVSFKGLARAFFGDPSDEELRRILVGGITTQVHAMEAAGAAPMVPSQFGDISPYNSAALGLLEARMLDVWNRPDFIADSVAETINSDLRAQKFIGVSIPGDVAMERKSGEQHARMQLTERYVTTPDTTNFGTAVDVTVEAVLFDRTGQVLANAEKVVETLRIRKEIRMADVFVGNVNTYTYDGVTYNTYVSSGGNWVNEAASNALADYTNINTAIYLATQMTDQETGLPVSIGPNRQLLVAPINLATTLHTLRTTTVERLTQTSTYRMFGDNPLVKMGIGDPMSSQWFWRQAQAMMETSAYGSQDSADAATTANGLWWYGDFKGAFGYLENIPFTTTRATPDSYTMADRRLVASIFVDEMGVPFVKEPRKVQRHWPSTIPSDQ